jgi:hypothetical protein
MKRELVIRKPQWYRMMEFFDGPAKVVTSVNDADVLLQGVLYEAVFPCPHCNHKIHMDKVNLKEDGRADLSPQLGLCLIPQEAISNQQGEALRRMLEANLRMPVLLISNNVQMVRLKPIMQAEADRILEEGAGKKDGEKEGQESQGRLVAFPGGGREAEHGGGEGVREGDRDGAPVDSGAESGRGDEQDQGGAQNPQGDAEGNGRGDPVGNDKEAPPPPGTEPDKTG